MLPQLRTPFLFLCLIHSPIVLAEVTDSLSLNAIRMTESELHSVWEEVRASLDAINSGHAPPQAEVLAAEETILVKDGSWSTEPLLEPATRLRYVYLNRGAAVSRCALLFAPHDRLVMIDGTSEDSVARARDAIKAAFGPHETWLAADDHPEVFTILAQTILPAAAGMVFLAMRRRRLVYSALLVVIVIPLAVAFVPGAESWLPSLDGLSGFRITPD